MPNPLFLTVASGFAVSSAGYFSRSDRGAWAVFVPSMSGNTVRLGFATASAAATAVEFATLNRWGVSTPSDVVVWSGTLRPAVAVVEHPPTPWVRVVVGAATTDTATFTLATAV